MKRWKRSAVFTGITLLLLAAGLFLLALAPQCAGVRFVLLDRIIAGQESLDWTETAADAAAMTLEALLADPRTVRQDTLLLVREGHPLPEGYAAPVEEYRDSGLRMTAETGAAYAALAKEAKERFGTKLYISSAFRTAEKQASLAESQGRYAAAVGESEHQTGLALDVYISGYAGKSLIRCETGQWLNRWCWQQGFILRYPYYGEGETGIPWEPWHLRYVGQPHAELIMKNRLTLEGYLSSLQPGRFYAWGDSLISRQQGDALLVPRGFSRAEVSAVGDGSFVLTFRLH